VKSKISGVFEKRKQEIMKMGRWVVAGFEKGLFANDNEQGRSGNFALTGRFARMLRWLGVDGGWSVKVWMLVAVAVNLFERAGFAAAGEAKVFRGRRPDDY